MPFDPLDPTHFPGTPEQRAADRFASLERRLGATERRDRNEVIARRINDDVLGEITVAAGATDAVLGPSVTVNVPDGAFVAVVASADLRTTLNGQIAAVGLSEDGTDLGSILLTTLSIYQSMFTVPGSNNGVTGPGGGRLIRTPAAGPHTYSLRYTAGAGASAQFRSRRLWVEVI